MKPDGRFRNNVGVWNGYVLGGRGREERRERLAEVPEALREQVRNHVETAIELRRRARIKQKVKTYYKRQRELGR